MTSTSEYIARRISEAGFVASVVVNERAGWVAFVNPERPTEQVLQITSVRMGDPKDVWRQVLEAYYDELYGAAWQEALKVGRLTYEHTRWCWRLARDPAVREASLDTRNPNPIGHLLWMRRWVKDRDRLALVLSFGTTPVALLRFDSKSCEVGIAVDAGWRGMGIGPYAVATVTAAARAAFPGTTCIARIRETNEASLRSFGKAGYRKVRARNGIVWLAA